MVDANKERMTGTVCWFDARKGFGFITKDDGAGDLFVHWSNIGADGFKTLQKGQVVEYVLGENHHGPQAVEVVVIRDVEEDADQ